MQKVHTSKPWLILAIPSTMEKPQFQVSQVDISTKMSLTKHRDLRTGAPVWMGYHSKIPAGARLRSNISVDVLVVGAGISGILTARSLVTKGFRVALVDRRGPLLGSTPASTALLQFEIDTPLIKLQRRIGARAAQTAWARSLAALRSLRETIRSVRIDAQVQVRRSLLLAGPLLNARALAAEVHARQRIGLPSQLLSRRELMARFGLRRSAAIVSEENLAANPRALGAGLLRRAVQAGAELYCPHEVAEVCSGARRVTAHTKDGRSIECRHAIFCTGYEMPSWVPMDGHKIASTWVLATGAQPRAIWPQAALIWEAADPYLYVRSTLDGRVICGGEDEPDGDAERRDAKIASKTRVLQRKLRALFPHLDTEAEYQWAGSFGQSDTGLPTIGQVPGHAHCYAVLGYGGNGLTFSVLAAELLTKAIMGQRDPDASIFAFQ
jgi:glycine/D-amino acid oxidase-like deaminating enzyme